MKRIFLYLLLLIASPALSQQQGLLTNAGLFLPTPTTQASSIVFSNVTDNSLTVTFTRGNGLNAMLIVKAGSAVNSFPIGNTTYTASPVFSSGSQIGTGNYVLSNGTDNSIDVTGLTPATTYHFFVSEYNGNPGGERYNINTATGNPASQLTEAVIIAPTVQATNITWTGDRLIGWDRGDGTFILVLAREGGAVDANPSDNVTYTADRFYGNGSEIGTGNFVVYKGTADDFLINVSSLQYSTTYGIRAYEFNGSGGSEKYFTNTATGNPLSHATQAQDQRYLYVNPIAQGIRDIPHPEDVSRLVSKAYSGGFVETATERLLYVVADNNIGPDNDYHFDQTFLKYQSITDDPADVSSWQWYDPGADGEPDPVLAFGAPEPGSTTSIQNWMATPTYFGDSLVAYYSVNVGNVAARYSVNRTVSYDSGRNWTRGTEWILAQTSGKNYYQFHHGFFDPDLNKWIMIGPDIGLGGSDGRVGKMNIYQSTDGPDGFEFDETANDIYAGTEIDSGGFCLQGPMWKDGGVYYWWATATHVPAYKARDDGSQVTYPYLNKQVVLVSCADITVANPVIIIEKVVYTSNQDSNSGIFPTSKTFSFGGKDYVIVNAFTWQAIEDAPGQLPIEVRVMTSDPVTLDAAQTIGEEVYPGYVYRYFKPHQTKVNDTYLSTVVSPYEVITSTAGTLVGSPTQHVLNKINVTSANYVTFPSFTHDQQYLAVSSVGDFVGLIDNVTRSLSEKEGTFKIFVHQSRFLEVWLYGVGGGIKKYRTTSQVNTNRTGIYFPDYTRFGFVARLNGGGTDITLELNTDYATNLAVTKIQDDVFTQIDQTANVFKIGNATSVTNPSPSVGSSVIFSGTANATQSNWLNNNLH